MMALYCYVLCGLPMGAALFAQHVLGYSVEQRLLILMPFMLGLGFVMHYGEHNAL